MALRIWFQSTVDIATYHSYREALEAHFRLVAPDVAVALHGVPPGTWGGLAPSQVMQMPYAYHKILSEVLFERLRRAEHEGYDAFVLGSFTEPWLRELRSMTDLPVVSTAEAAVHVACSVAQKFALVTMNVENEYAEMLAKLHRHTGLKPGRRWHYVRPTEAVLAFIDGRSAGIG